jgi:hypothetical protein
LPGPNQRAIQGKVVDSRAAPLAGVVVCACWKPGEKLVPEVPEEAMTTDAQGEFKGVVGYNGRPLTLLAVDAEGKLGGTVPVDEKSIDSALTIRMEPLIVVRGELKAPETGVVPAGTGISISAGTGSSIIRGLTGGPKFQFRLPPGEFKFTVYRTAAVQKVVRKQLSLSRESPQFDLGVLDLQLTILGRLQGKELPPWSVAEARGIDKGVTLSDLKGKWVVLEFWGYW